MTTSPKTSASSPAAVIIQNGSRPSVTRKSPAFATSPAEAAKPDCVEK